MYCKKCGQLIPDSAKFCPKCGLEVKRKDPLIYEIKCENCGSTMDYSETPESNIVFVCPQCGSKKILVKNAAEKNSESFQKDFESGEYGKNDNNDEIELVSFGNQGRLNQEQEKAVIPKEKTNEKNAPKSNVTFQRNYKENKNVYKSFDSNKKQSKVFRNIILFFLFVTLACCVYFYFQHNMMKFAISMIQAFLLISAWLNNRGFLRKDKKYLFILLTVLSLALFYPMIKLGNDFYKTDDQEEVYVWPETELGVVIPNPRLKKGKISWSHDDKFYITYSDANESDFTGYIKECQDSGFNVDHSQSSSSFTAYNSDGYYVCVHYWSGLKEISITAQAPEKLGENYWPTTGMAEILPKPDESLGLVIRDTSELLSVDIHGNKKDVFIYAEKCIEEGFSVNYQRTEKSYYAENEQGYSLKIVYEGGEIINIRLEAPATAEEPESLDTTSLTDTKNVDTEYNVQTEDNNSPDVTQRESAASSTDRGRSPGFLP